MAVDARMVLELKPRVQKKDVNEIFSNAVVAGNLVTAAAWPGHRKRMRKFLKVLGTKIET